MMRGRWGWGVWLGFACLYALSIGRGFYSSDGEVMFQTTAALVERHTWTLDADPALPQIVPGADSGTYYSKYDPGLPLVMAPFFALGDAWGAAYAAHRHTLAATCVLLVSALAAAGSVAGVAVVALQSAALFRQDRACPIPTKPHFRSSQSKTPVCPTGEAENAPRGMRVLLLVLAAGIATPLWAYGRELFPEAVLACALTWVVVSLAFFCQSAHRGVLPYAATVVAGVAFGIGIMTRAALAIYGPALVWLIWRCSADRRAFWGRGAALVMGIAPFVGIVLWHNALRFDDPLRFGYAGEGFSTPVWKGILGLLVSPGKSVFVYAPPLIVSLLLWPRFRRVQPALAGFLALAWGSALVFYGAWWAWDGGWCWGPRLLVPLLPLSMLPLLALPDRRAWCMALVVLVALGAGINVLGVMVDVVPLYADVAREQAADVDAVNWALRDAPVVWSVERVINGHTEPLGILHLQDTGLPPLWSRGVPVILLAGLGGGVWVLLRDVWQGTCQ